MNDFMFTINAILPIILIVVLGYFLKRIKFFKPGFLGEANKLVFKVFLPILLFYNVYNIEDISKINVKFLIYIVVSIIVLFLIGVIVVKIAIKDPKQKGVFLQSVFRSNYAIIGIPLATSLASNLSGDIANEVIANAALASLFGIPLFNVLAVIALTMFDNSESVSKKDKIIDVLKGIGKNPLILGVLSGFISLSIRSLLVKLNIDFTIKNDAKFLYTTIKNIALIASPLALVVLGGQFEFKSTAKLKYQLSLSVFMRLVFTPILGLGIAYALGFRTLEFPALIGVFATPIAVSSVPMASMMGQDDELAGQIVVWTTLLSIFSLFIIIMICRNIGIF